MREAMMDGAEAELSAASADGGSTKPPVTISSRSSSPVRSVPVRSVTPSSRESTDTYRMRSSMTDVPLITSCKPRCRTLSMADEHSAANAPTTAMAPVTTVVIVRSRARNAPGGSSPAPDSAMSCVARTTRRPMIIFPKVRPRPASHPHCTAMTWTTHNAANARLRPDSRNTTTPTTATSNTSISNASSLRPTDAYRYPVPVIEAAVVGMPDATPRVDGAV